MEITGGFTKAQRLSKPSEFQYIFKRPCKCSSRYFTLLARKNDNKPARLGLAVPKRQIKRAVARNRLKRLIREGFRRHQAELSGLDVIVLARGSAAELTNREITTALDGMWQQLKQRCVGSSSD